MPDLGKLAYLFIQGFAVGSGPCLLICAPILLPYIAGTKRTWQEGLKATLVFGLTRLLVYTLLGGAVGYIGYYLFRLFLIQFWGAMLAVLAGTLIILLGLLIVAGKEINDPFCKYLQKNTVEKGDRSMVWLGVILGLSPCLPLIAVLMEIMFISAKFYQGFLYGLAFGIGTVISPPLLLLGTLAPLISGKIQTRYFNMICGSLLILFGIYLILNRVM
jgi:sulfite exporter TauE/SafE